MRSVGIAALGLAAALFSEAPMAQADIAQSKAFIAKAIQGNIAEVMLGHLAQTNARRDKVRRFGEELISDYSNANQRALAAARALGVAPPTAPNPNQQQVYERLARESGTPFDRDFLQVVIQDHTEDINDYHKETSNGGDPAAHYAQATLPTLRKQLQTAQVIAGRPKAIYLLQPRR